MKKVRLIYYLISIACSGCTNSDNLKLKVVVAKPCDLYDSLSKSIGDDISISVYFPYSGIRKSVARVILTRPYFLAVDVSPALSVSTFDDSSMARYKFISSRYFHDDTKALDDFVVAKLRKLRKLGIYTMGKSNNFLQIQTVFFDSSYSSVKQGRKNFFDVYCESISMDSVLLSAYCLGFYVFDQNDTSQRKDWMLTRPLTFCSNNIAYYRTPLSRVQVVKAAVSEK